MRIDILLNTAIQKVIVPIAFVSILGYVLYNLWKQANFGSLKDLMNIKKKPKELTALEKLHQEKAELTGNVKELTDQKAIKSDIDKLKKQKEDLK